LKGRQAGRGSDRNFRKPAPPRSEDELELDRIRSKYRLVLGANPVTELIRARRHEVYEVLVEHQPGPRAEATARFARDNGIAVTSVPRAELERLSAGTMHQGIAAFGPDLQLVPFSKLSTEANLLALALDGIVDPQNFGAAVRSAVGLCDAPVLWSENASAPLTPATFRASAGAIEHARLCRVASLHGTLSEAALSGTTVVGLAPDAPSALHELDLSGPTIIVIGSEEKGMNRAVRKACTAMARITSSRSIQSLNASVAAGIALHAALIQRPRLEV
jgi:23S rRNA (guanosine2251-2'-O)-methyltransferase